MKSRNSTIINPGTTLYLDDEYKILEVMKGYLDVFIVCESNGSLKRRISVGRVNQKELLFCFKYYTDKIAEKIYRLIAYTYESVEVKYKNIEDLKGDEINTGFERWIKLLLSVNPEYYLPPSTKYISKNKIYEIRKNDLLSSYELVWIKKQDALNFDFKLPYLKFTKQSKLDCLPLYFTHYIRAKSEGEYFLKNTASAIREQSYKAIEKFCLHYIASLKDIYNFYNERDKSILELKRCRKEEDLQSTINTARVIMDKKGLLDVNDSGNDLNIYNALNRVSRCFNVKLKKTKLSINDFISPIEYLKGLASENDFFIRKIVLEGKWWLNDGLSFVAFDKNTYEAYPVITQYDAYHYYDVKDRKTEKVNDVNGDKILSFGYTMHPVITNEKVCLVDIIKLALLGTKRDLFMIIISSFIVAMLGLLTPIFTNIIIDKGIVFSNISLVLQLMLALIIVSISIFFFGVIKCIAIVRMSGRASAVSQSAVIDRLYKLPLRIFRKYSAGDLAVRALGVEQIQKILTGAHINSVLSGIFSFLSLALMFYYSVKLALIGLCMVLVVSFVILAVSFFQYKYLKEKQDLFGESNGLAFQLINGLAKLKIMDKEMTAFSVWGDIYFKFCRKNYLSRLLERNEAVTESALHSIALIIIIGCISWLLKGHMAVAAFVAFLTAFGQFSTGVKTLTAVVGQILPVKVLFDRMKPIFETETELMGGKCAEYISGRIDFNNVSFRYDKDSALILDNISMRIASGEFIAIVGPSGAGKSTLFRILLGLDMPEQGSVYYDGQDISGLNLRELRKKIGVVTQNAQLIPGNIYENITGGGQYTFEEAWQAAVLAGLEEDIKSFPMQMHTIVAENAGTFSGGQKQRLVLARALIKKPKIILLDEATSALDNKTQDFISRNLENLKMTRIVIAHRLSTIKNADRIYVLNNGVFIEAGTYDELMVKKQFFYNLAKRQLI